MSCRDLTKRFGAFTATDKVNSLRCEEIFGLLGPNGWQVHLTFQDALCGPLKPTAGEAHVVGHDLRRAFTCAAKSRLGYMAQKFSPLRPAVGAAEPGVSAGVYGLEGSTRRERIAEMIETLTWRLAVRHARLPCRWPQQRAWRWPVSLMHRPPVLFLDEPTSGVNPITRREFWTHINGLARKGVTTHGHYPLHGRGRILRPKWLALSRAQLIALDTPDVPSALSARNTPIRPWRTPHSPGRVGGSAR